MQDLAYKSKSTLITLSVSATVFVILDCVLAYYHPLRCLYSAIGNGTKFPFRAYVPYPITAARS